LLGIPGALFGASWGANDLILFARGRDIATVPASGGTPLVVATANSGKGRAVLSTPQWLPGGKAILFTASSADWTRAQVVTQSLDGGEPRVLLSGAADARYIATGHLVYMKLGTLLAVSFDPVRMQVTGAPVAMIEDVMQAVNMPGSDETGVGQYVVAGDGTLAYIAGGIHPAVRNQLVWVDRRGVESSLKLPPGPIRFPRVSPEGQRLVYTMRREATSESDVWIYDLARDTPTRLTLAGDNNEPAWSPDGRRVIFGSGHPRNLFWVAADGSSSPERLTTGPFDQYASSASRNNIVAVVDSYGDAPSQISVLPLEGERKPQPLRQSPFALRFPAFSNDGRWLAYMSNESGRSEVYVQAYPGRGEKHRISAEIGHAPVWGRNGRELFYLQGTPPTPITMMAVDIDTVRDFTAARPHALFTGPYIAMVPVRNYDVSPDGQRFIMLKEVGEREKPPSAIEIVLNWTEELKRRVPITH
jgi:eukaryotic-like serine/threonine-protein kinase